jgi:hypothetical protein
MRTSHQTIQPSARRLTAAKGKRRYAGGFIEYDADRRRVWVGGQRLHHGLTGALVASAGLAGLAAHRVSPRGSLEVALFGSVLMAHDWHDRTHWFERGYQSED